MASTCREGRTNDRKLQAMNMRVELTCQRPEDLEGIVHGNLHASSWADETNPLAIWQSIAVLEVQHFIQDSKVTYESLSTDESEAKTEATLTSMGAWQQY